MKRYIAKSVLILLIIQSFQTVASVDWQPWSKKSFARAEAENKLILINVGMEGCTACNRMEEYTYSNKEVAELLNKHFISIAVDSQARPDVGERYSDWAWPATAFLIPDGTQIFAMAGNRFPESFLPILNDLIQKHKNGVLRADPNSPYKQQVKPVTTPITKVRDGLRSTIDSQLNVSNGGWSEWGLNAEADGARLEHLYMRAHLNKDEKMKAIALAISAKFIETIDPVWGGAYESLVSVGAANVPEEFSKLRAVPEKRITNQANAITAFATAYKLTGEERYVEAVHNIDEYLDTWMRSPKGTWFTSQKDTPPLLPSNWWPQDYWLLTTDKERRKYGVPPIDHAIYTDKNSEVIIAYLHAYNAFGDSSYLAKARQATESLLASQLTRDGWMQQVVRTEKIKQDVRLRHQSKLDSPLLIAQSRFGVALLKLHQETGEKRWLHQAESLSKSLMNNLYDQKNGGFWASTPTGDDPIGPRKPLEDNSVTAQFIYDLSVISKDLSLAGVAEKTFRSVVSPNVLAREGKATGETALLAEKLAAEYVEYSVVTNDPTSEKSRSLHSIGRSIYHPRKIVHYEAPGRYPSFDEPVVFICSPNRCSLPLSSEEEIRKIAEVF